MNTFAQASELPLLHGPNVYLAFLTEAHREPLRQLAKDERIWEFTKTILLTDTYNEQFDKYFNEALANTGPNGQSFVKCSTADNSLIGMTRIYDVEHRVQRATIGHTWYIPSVWGKIHNKECKLLLLQYLFETKGMQRVEFRVASQNIRSQKAVMKIGGIREGVLRRYVIRNDGTPTDTHIFSILAEEWQSEKKSRLQQLAEAL
ncbi:MAG: GNAT family N-acetyltransferase [Bacteroidetes bacterium]|nr:GNAT family N-acetyltransferase [Bacteroidota bacterium]